MVESNTTSTGLMPACQPGTPAKIDSGRTGPPPVYHCRADRCSRTHGAAARPGRANRALRCRSISRSPRAPDCALSLSLSFVPRSVNRLTQRPNAPERGEIRTLARAGAQRTPPVLSSILSPTRARHCTSTAARPAPVATTTAFSAAPPPLASPARAGRASSGELLPSPWPWLIR